MEMIDIIIHPNPIKQEVVKLEISATWGDLLSKLESEYEATISLYVTNSSGYGDEGFDNPKINIDHSTKLVDFGHYEFDCEVNDFEFDSSPTIIVSFGKHRKIIKSGKVQTLLKNEEIEVELDRKRFKRRVKNLCLVTETVDESTKKYLCRSYQIIGEPEKIEIDEEGTVRKIVDSEVGSNPAQCIRSGAEAETDLMRNKKVLKAVGNLSIDLIKAVVQAVVSGAVSGAM